jgi:hypothetical protein
MGIITIIKRTFQAAGCLIIAGVMAVSGLASYVEANPVANDRMEVIEREAKQRVDEDAGFFEKVGAIIAAWWDADELVAEAEQDKALNAHSKKKQEERERDRRFNDSQYSESDDYYGSTN